MDNITAQEKIRALQKGFDDENPGAKVKSLFDLVLSEFDSRLGPIISRIEKIEDRLGERPKQVRAIPRAGITFEKFKSMSQEEFKKTRISDREAINILIGLQGEDRDAIRVMKEEIEKLKTKGVCYRGTWQRSEEYRKGDITTRDGSGWISLRDLPEGAPGNSEHWQLMIKGTR